MKEPVTESSKGNLPRAELSSVPKEQKGKGVNVGGKLSPIMGTRLKTKGDKQTSKLRKVWNKAVSAKSKFETFTRNL